MRTGNTRPLVPKIPVVAVVLSLFFAPVGVFAKIYPPGSGGACPETLTIAQVNNSGSACHPALGDTVLAVKGIVTALGHSHGLYTLFMQNSAGGAYSAIRIETYGANYAGPVAESPSGGYVTVGDSIAVSGTVTEGLTGAINDQKSIECPGLSYEKNSIVIRRIASGQVLPPYRNGTTSDYEWIPNSTSPSLTEPYVGSLVQVQGSLRVARTHVLDSGDPGLFLVVDNANPTDSILVDGSSLTKVGTPLVGTTLTGVRGVLARRADLLPEFVVEIDSYVIELSQVSDLQTSTGLPPHLVDAFALPGDHVAVLFDRAVTALTAENVNHYSLANFEVNVDSAVNRFHLRHSDSL